MLKENLLKKKIEELKIIYLDSSYFRKFEEKNELKDLIRSISQNNYFFFHILE